MSKGYFPQPTIWDQVQDGMVSALALIALPASPGVPTSLQYVRTIERYFGQLSSPEAIQESGISGRTPAILIAFTGEKSLRTTIGRRIDRVEASFAAICCTDYKRNIADSGKQLFQLMSDARLYLADRKLGLDAITPLRYRGISMVREDAELIARGVQLTAIYAADYTKSPGTDVILSTTGQMTAVHSTMPAPPPQPVATVIGPPGTTRYGYVLVTDYLDGQGNPLPSSNASPEGFTTTGPAAINPISNYIQLTWPAIAPPQRLRIYRVTTTAPSGPGATLGLIADFSVFTMPASFQDTGGPGDGVLPRERAVGAHVTF